jgi:hypothetical protein
MRKIFIILILALFIGLLLFKYTYTKGTDYILISNDSTALVLDNWTGVRKVKSLFNINYHFYDCCSGTGDIIYFIQSPKQYYEVTRETDNLYLYNSKKISKTLSELTDKAKNHPNYSLYSLTIPISHNIDSVISILTDNKLKVLLPFDYEDQLPSLVIDRIFSNIKPENSYGMMKQIEDSIKLLTNDYKLSKLSSSVSEGLITSTKNTFTFQYELTFRDNNMLNSFLSEVDTSIFKVENIKYMAKQQLWLLSREPNISNVRTKLINRFDFIEDIRYK